VLLVIEALSPTLNTVGKKWTCPVKYSGVQFVDRILPLMMYMLTRFYARLRPRLVLKAELDSILFSFEFVPLYQQPSSFFVSEMGLVLLVVLLIATS